MAKFQKNACTNKLLPDESQQAMLKPCKSISIFQLFTLILLASETCQAFSVTDNDIKDSSALWSKHEAPIARPYFDLSSSSKNVTVIASKTAILSCVVHNLANNTVAWIRHRDLHILSVGKITYTNDDRFQAVSQEDNGEWLLRIQYANVKDSGQYECQISTKPPISHTIHLDVIEPRARIMKGPEMHVSAGSLINLTCIIPYSPETPDYLYWYHKDQMVRGDNKRISIDNQLGTRSISQLKVRNASPSDTGVYTCSPAHSKEQSITVHVVTDGLPAAMQGGSTVTSVGHMKLMALMLIPLLITFKTVLTFHVYM